MKVYKVIFARNEVVLCNESMTRLPEDTEVRFEQSNGHLIYAFVRAETAVEAVRKANQIAPKLVAQLINPPGGDPSATPRT